MVETNETRDERGEHKGDGDNRGNVGTTVVTIIVILLLGALLFWFISDNNNDEITDTVDDAASSIDESINDDDLLSRIVDNPEDYYGQTVTVSGEIQDVYDARLFKISDQTIGDELLILSKQPLTAEQLDEAEEFFEDNADVSATGVVREWTVSDLEQEFNIDIPQEIEDTIDSRAVVVADSLTITDSNAVFDFNQGPGN